MPQCQICSSSFPNLVRIDGAVRNLCSRKYCLACSPFGLHNTRDPRLRGPVETSCSDCGRWYVYDKQKGHSRTRCNSCVVNGRREPMKRKAVEYKGGKCVLCGYDRCLKVLVFHHVDPKGKDFGIGKNTNRSWSSIRKELDKCVLLCSNCHGEVHAGVAALPSLSIE